MVVLLLIGGGWLWLDSPAFPNDQCGQTERARLSLGLAVAVGLSALSPLVGIGGIAHYLPMATFSLVYGCFSLSLWSMGYPEIAQRYVATVCVAVAFVLCFL
jgi:hypothetical protein